MSYSSMEQHSVEAKIFFGDSINEVIMSQVGDVRFFVPPNYPPSNSNMMELEFDGVTLPMFSQQRDLLEMIEGVNEERYSIVYHRLYSFIISCYTRCKFEVPWIERQVDIVIQPTEGYEFGIEVQMSSVPIRADFVKAKMNHYDKTTTCFWRLDKHYLLKFFREYMNWGQVANIISTRGLKHISTKTKLKHYSIEKSEGMREVEQILENEVNLTRFYKKFHFKNPMNEAQFAHFMKQGQKTVLDDIMNCVLTKDNLEDYCANNYADSPETLKIYVESLGLKPKIREFGLENVEEILTNPSNSHNITKEERDFLEQCTYKNKKVSMFPKMSKEELTEEELYTAANEVLKNKYFNETKTEGGVINSGISDFQGDKVNSYRGLVSTVIRSDEDLKDIKQTLESRIRDFTVGDKTMSNLIKTSAYKSDPTFLENVKKILRISEKVKVEDLQKKASNLGYKINGRGMVRLNMTDSMLKTLGIKTRLVERRSNLEEELRNSNVIIIRSIENLLECGLLSNINLDNYYVNQNIELIRSLATEDTLVETAFLSYKLKTGVPISVDLKNYNSQVSKSLNKIIISRQMKPLIKNWVEKEISKLVQKNYKDPEISKIYNQRSTQFNNNPVFQIKIIYDKEVSCNDKYMFKNMSGTSYGRSYNFHNQFDKGIKKIIENLDGVSNKNFTNLFTGLSFKEMKWVDPKLQKVTKEHLVVKEFSKLPEHSLLMAETALNQVIAKNSRATRERVVKPTIDGFKIGRILSNSFIVYSDAPTDDSTGVVFIIFRRERGAQREWWEPKIYKISEDIYFTSPVRFNMGYVKSTMDHTVGTLATRLMEYILVNKSVDHCTSMSPWMIRLSSNYSRNLRAITDWTKQMYAQFQSIASFGKIDIKEKFNNIIETDVFGYACSRIELNFNYNYNRYLLNIVENDRSISGITDLITSIPYKHHQSLQMMSALNNFLIRDDRANENSKKTEFTHNEAKFQEEYDQATTSGIRSFSYIDQSASDFFEEVFPRGTTTPYSVYHNAILYSTTLLKDTNKGKDIVTINEMDNVSRGKPSSLNKVLTGKEETLNRKQKLQDILVKMTETKFQNMAEIASKINSYNKTTKANYEEQSKKLKELRTSALRTQTIILAIHNLSSTKIRRIRKNEALTEDQIKKNKEISRNIMELYEEYNIKISELEDIASRFSKPISNLVKSVRSIFNNYLVISDAESNESLEMIEEEYAIKGKTGVYASKNSQLIYELELETKKDIIDFIGGLDIPAEKIRKLQVAVNNSDLTNKVVSLMALIKGYKKADVTLEVKRTEANFDKRGFFMQSVYTHVINQLADTSLIPILPKLYSNIQESGNRKNLIFDDIVGKTPYFLAMAFDMTKFGDKMVLEGLATFIKGAVYNKMIDQELGNWLTVCIDSLYGRVLIVPDSVQKVISEYKAYKKLLTKTERTKEEDHKLISYRQKFNRTVYKGEESTDGSKKLSSMCEIIISECEKFKASKEYKSYPTSITANYCIRITRGFILGVLNMFGTVMSAMSRIIEEKMYLWLGLSLSFYKGIAQSDDCLSFYFLRPDSRAMFRTKEYKEFKKKVSKNCFNEINNVIVWRDSLEPVDNDLLYTLVLEIAFLVARFYGLRFGTLKSRPGRREMLQVDYIDKSWVPALMKFTYTIFKNIDEGDFQNSLLQASTGGIQSLRTYGARGDIIENILVFNQLMVYYYSKISPKENVLKNTPMLGGIYFAHYPEIIEHGFSAYSGYILNNVIHSKRYERQFSACILNPNIYNTVRQYTNKESEEKVNLLNFVKLDIKKPQSGIVFKLLDPLTKEFIKYSRFHIGEFSKNNLLSRFTETESIILDFEIKLSEIERLISEEESLTGEYLKLLKSRTAEEEEILLYKDELKTARDNKVGALLGLNPLISCLAIVDVLDLRKRYGIITSMIKRPKETDESRQLRVMASMKYWIIKNPFSEELINTLKSKEVFTSDLEAEYMSWEQIISIIDYIASDDEIPLGDYKDLFIDSYKKEILSARAKYAIAKNSSVFKMAEKDFKWDIKIKLESGDMSVRALLVYYIKLELESKTPGLYQLRNNAEYDAVTSEFDTLSEDSKNKVRKIHDTLSYYNIRTTSELVKNINIVETLFNRFRRSEVIRLPLTKPNKFLMYNYTEHIINLVRQSDLSTDVVSPNSKVREMFMGKYSDLTTLVSLVNSVKAALIVKRKTGCIMDKNELKMYRVFKTLSGRALYEKFSIKSGSRRVSFSESMNSTLISFSDDPRTAKNWFTKMYIENQLKDYQILMNVSGRRRSDSVILTDRIRELVIIKNHEYTVLVREFKSSRKVVTRADNITSSTKGTYNKNKFTVNIILSGENVRKVKISEEKTIVWASNIAKDKANQNLLTHTKINEIMYTVIHILRLFGIKEKVSNMFRNRTSDYTDEKIQFEKDIAEATERIRNKIIKILSNQFVSTKSKLVLGSLINDVIQEKISDFNELSEKITKLKLFKHESSIRQIVDLKLKEFNRAMSVIKRRHMTKKLLIDNEFIGEVEALIAKFNYDIETSCTDQISRVGSNRYSVACNDGNFYLNENDAWRISIVKSFVCSPNRVSQENFNGFIFRKLVREKSGTLSNTTKKVEITPKVDSNGNVAYNQSGEVFEESLVSKKIKIDEISKLKLPRGAKESSDFRKMIIKGARHIQNLNFEFGETPYRLTPFYKMEGGKYILILDELLVTENLIYSTDEDSNSSISSDDDTPNNDDLGNSSDDHFDDSDSLGNNIERLNSKDILEERFLNRKSMLKYKELVEDREAMNRTLMFEKENPRETTLTVLIPGEKESNFSGHINIIAQYQPYIRHFYFNEPGNIKEEDIFHLTYTIAFLMDALKITIDDLNKKVLDSNSYEKYICMSAHSPSQRFLNYAIKLIFNEMNLTSEEIVRVAIDQFKRIVLKRKENFSELLKANNQLHLEIARRDSSIREAYEKREKVLERINVLEESYNIINSSPQDNSEIKSLLNNISRSKSIYNTWTKEIEKIQKSKELLEMKLQQISFEINQESEMYKNSLDALSGSDILRDLGGNAEQLIILGSLLYRIEYDRREGALSSIRLLSKETILDQEILSEDMVKVILSMISHEELSNYITANYYKQREIIPCRHGKLNIIGKNTAEVLKFYLPSLYDINIDMLGDEYYEYLEGLNVLDLDVGYGVLSSSYNSNDIIYLEGLSYEYLIGDDETTKNLIEFLDKERRENRNLSMVDSNLVFLSKALGKDNNKNTGADIDSDNYEDVDGNEYDFDTEYDQTITLTQDELNENMMIAQTTNWADIVLN